MDARIVRGRSQPGYLDQIIAIYADAIVPSARQQPGFHTAFLLADRDTGTLLSLTLWEDAASMQASERGGYLRAQLEKVQRYWTDDPIIETGTLRSIGDLSAVPGRPLYARVTTGVFRGGDPDDGHRAVQQQPGFAGLLELTNPSTGGGMVVMLYESAAQAGAAGATTTPRAASAGTVAHDVYEVSVAATAHPRRA